MAATDVERLAILIEAQTSNYERAMKRIEQKTNQAMGRSTRSVKTLDTQMKTAAASARNFMAAFGITLGIGGIIQLTRSIRGAVSEMAALAETADKVGVLTTELQELRFAAEQTGVAQSALDMGLQRFSRRVGEAVQGGGELKGTLDQYNIALTDSEGRTRPVVAILKDYADAIRDAESQQEKLRLAFKGFDSEGAALVNTLKDGAAGLDVFFARARELGVVLDEEGIRKAKALDAQFKELSATISTKFKSSVLGAADFLGTLSDAMDAVSDARVRLGASLGGPDTQATVDRMYERLTRGRGDFEGNLGEFPLLPAPGAPGKSLPPLPRRKPDRGGGGSGDASDTDRAREALERLFETQRMELDLLREIDPVQREMIRHRETLAAAIGTEKQDMERLLGTIFELREAEAQAAEQIAFFQNAAFGALDGLIIRGAKATDVLRDLVSQLARAGLHSAIFGGGLFGGPGIGSLFGGGPTNIVPLAGGGPVTAGSPYMVGEKGPELFLPKSSGQIIPNGRGAGFTVNAPISIDARGAQRGAAEEIVAAAERRILPQIVGVVREAQSRRVQL